MQNNSRLVRCFVVLVLFVSSSYICFSQAADRKLQSHLESVYMHWREAMIKKNFNLWAQHTAVHKQISIRNRILSEKKSYPASIFVMPAAPPSLEGLKALRIESKGSTASAVYFGKVDFGVGGRPGDNVLMLSFIYEKGAWKYSNVDFFNLNQLPEKRKELQSGNLNFVKEKGFGPSGVVPEKPIQIRSAVPYIAKVYVVCPGREVIAKVNKISDHRFQNNIISEVVIGGANNGLNEISFSTRALKGSTGKEALAIRVYLMSTVRGVKPLKVFEYLVPEGEKVKPFGTENFFIGPAQAKLLMAQ